VSKDCVCEKKKEPPNRDVEVVTVAKLKERSKTRPDERLFQEFKVVPDRATGPEKSVILRRGVAVFPAFVIEESIKGQVKKRRARTAAEVKELKRNAVTFPTVLDKKCLNKRSYANDLGRVGELVESFNELTIVSGNKKDGAFLRVVKTAAKGGEKFGLVSIAAIFVHLGHRRKVANDMDGDGSSGKNCLPGSVDVVRAPFTLASAKKLPDLSTEVTFPIAGRAGKDHRSWPAGAFFRSGIKKRKELLFNRMQKCEWPNASPPGRLPDALVVHTVVSRGGSVLS
jgi:hypothetical protein